MLVQHDGFVGIYSHFSMVKPAFAEGKRTIAAGEQLGEVGITGVTSGAHLYFEMDLAGRPVDPAPYIGVPDCDGGVRRTLSRSLDADGNTRQYYQYQSGWQYYQPVRQYYDWQRHEPWLMSNFAIRRGVRGFGEVRDLPYPRPKPLHSVLPPDVHP
jgi:hypothetical protein